MAKAKTISMYRIVKDVKNAYHVSESEAKAIAISFKYNYKKVA